MNRIILTTGGTGGHIFPALAVAEEIRRRFPECMILFMGGQHGQEADLAANAGIDFVGLPVKGVVGRGGRGVFAAVGMVRGLMKALGIMRKVRPELVIGFGGYAAFAGVLAGRMAGRATAVHEQNSLPGLTNRLLGKVVDRVFLSMPDAAGAFDPAKTLLVGNPVRAAIAELYERAREKDLAAAERAGAKSLASSMSCYGGVDAASPFDAAGRGKEREGNSAARASCGSGAAGGTSGRTTDQIVPASDEARESSSLKAGPRRAPHLLVMGGSLGARAINEGIVAALGPLLEAGIEIWHQTGQADHEAMRSAYREARAGHVRVEPFITDMQRAYAWADLALCRAGGSSVAELTAAGLPAVLVPFPFAAGDHQRHNARFLVDEGGAVVLEQERFYGKNGDPRPLVEILTSLLADRERLQGMALRSLAVARPYAAGHMVDELEALAQSGRNQFSTT